MEAVEWWRLILLYPLLLDCCLLSPKAFAESKNVAETMRLKMQGTCICSTPNQGYINLTSLGLTNGFPRFPDFNFPERNQFTYFFNPCFPFSWPPEYLSKSQYNDYTSKWKSSFGPSSSNGLRWFDKWAGFLPKEKKQSYYGKCKKAAFCRYDNNDNYQTVAKQETDDSNIYCQLNKTINGIQIVYKGDQDSDLASAGFVLTLVCDPDREVPKLDPVYDEGKTCQWWFCREGWKYVTLYHKCACPGLCGEPKVIPYSADGKSVVAVNSLIFVLAVVLVGMVISALMFWFWRHQKLKQEYGRLVWEQRAYGTLTDHVIPYRAIELKEMVGDGSYGVVYRGLWRNTEVAVKRIREGLVEEDMDAFKREATVLSNLRHHNIVQFMGVCLMKPNFCIVTEFMEGGSVADIIHSKRTILPWETRLKWAMDAAKGMAFLHAGTPPMMHRDFKSDNLLVDENGLVKVADFGTTKILECVMERRRKNQDITSLRGSIGFTGYHTRLVGTIRWVAPEVMQALGDEGPARYSNSADVYSYGVTVWETITNRRPFCEMQWDHEVMDAVQAGQRPEIPSFCLPEMTEFLQACWHHNPQERPTFVEILQRLEEMATYKPNTGSKVVLPGVQYLGVPL